MSIFVLYVSELFRHISHFSDVCARKILFRVQENSNLFAFRL